MYGDSADGGPSSFYRTIAGFGEASEAENRLPLLYY
jgi:hypothetical protein